MGRILIFEDIMNNLLARPRDATLIGEENLISREKGCDEDYDLYYYCINGTGHNINLDAEYKQIPVFSDFGIQILKDYYEKCPQGMMGFYGTGRKLLICDYDSLKVLEENFKKAGLEGKANFTTIKREELFQRQKESGIYGFEEELNKKCKYIKSHLI